MKKTSSTILFLLIFLISSCVKDITETLDKASKVSQVRWNPKIALPLLYSDLNFRDLLDETNAKQYIRIDDDSLVSLVYEDNYNSDYAENVLKLETQSYGEIFTFKHNDFWLPMDTLRDKNKLNKLWNDNKAPWKIWEK